MQRSGLTSVQETRQQSASDASKKQWVAPTFQRAPLSEALEEQGPGADFQDGGS